MEVSIKVQMMMILTMKEGAAEEEVGMIRKLNQILFLLLINHPPLRKIKIVREVLIQRLSHNKEMIKKMKGCLGMN